MKNISNILVVSATQMEVKPLLRKLEIDEENQKSLYRANFGNLEIDVLITGVGMVKTTHKLTKQLNQSYDLVINIGVCGSFSRELELGTVVDVFSDLFSELGAITDERFIEYKELNIPEEDDVIAFNNGDYMDLNQAETKRLFAHLPEMHGITVNTVHGGIKSANEIIARLDPEVESMEGAAVLYVCNEFDIPGYQIRGVSNYVGERDKEKWELDLAITNSCQCVYEFIKEIQDGSH